jgi:hypothetical protein
MAILWKWVAAASIANIAAPAAAVERIRAEGIEIISGRPAPATPAPSFGVGFGIPALLPDSQLSPASRPQTMRQNEPVEDPPHLAEPDSGSTTKERLRAAEAVLHRQVDAYNHALLENTGEAVIRPLEAAIGRTLEHIETLLHSLRPARALNSLEQP